MKLQKEACEIIILELQKALEDNATFAPRQEVEWAFIELIRYTHGETNENQSNSNIPRNGSTTRRKVHM